MAAARRIIEEWRIDYNEHRPHTSLRGLTPNEFATPVQNGPRGEQGPVMNEGSSGATSCATMRERSRL